MSTRWYVYDAAVCGSYRGRRWQVRDRCGPGLYSLRSRVRARAKARHLNTAHEEVLKKEWVARFVAEMKRSLTASSPLYTP